MRSNNYEEICSNLFKRLDARQKDVLSRRFSLNGFEKGTLEAIGKNFGICRERVRQVEKIALLEVKKHIDQYQETFSDFVSYINKFGGVRKEEELLEGLGKESKNEIVFLLNLSDLLKNNRENKDYYSFWSVDDKLVSKAKETIRSISKELKKKQELVTFEKIKIMASEEEEILMSYLSISKKVQKNSDNLYGLSDWPEINPKGVRDKAYVAFKGAGKPLHFSEVSELIKGSNVQTVHNELIKADKFVLVGRGMYALSEWGYTPGELKEVIIKTLEDEGGPMLKNDIIEKVLKQRIVKKSTISLWLGDKNKFIKDSDGRYNIKSS